MKEFRIITMALLLCTVFNANAQEKEIIAKSYAYVERDSTLYLDVYKPENAPELNKTAIYVFGGGFTRGDKSQTDNVAFYKTLVESGFNVVAINYRLGLNGVGKVGISNRDVIFDAVDLASEDLISATDFIIKNHVELGIDTAKIALIGSSAGAITILRTDYELANRSEMVKALPESFRYKAVVSLAGALFTRTGKTEYKNKPAPTLFCHGTKDDIVQYDGLKLFKYSMLGTSKLTEIFHENNFSYATYRFLNAGHEVAEFPRLYMPEKIVSFINAAINPETNINRQYDTTISDSYVNDTYNMSISLDDIYGGK